MSVRPLMPLSYIFLYINVYFNIFFILNQTKYLLQMTVNL